MLKALLMPGQTLFRKAFTLVGRQDPATQQPRVIYVPSKVSRLYLLAAVPASTVDLIVISVVCGIIMGINAISFNSIDPNANKESVNLLVNLARRHIRTWVLLVNPENIYYSVGFNFNCPNENGQVISTSIPNTKQELYSHYFWKKTFHNHSNWLHTPRTTLWSRVKINFEGCLCARINNLCMTVIAFVESIRYSASLAYNLIKYKTSSIPETYPHYLISNQLRLIVSLERIWEGAFGVIFNEEYSYINTDFFTVPKI